MYPAVLDTSTGSKMDLLIILIGLVKNYGVPILRVSTVNYKILFHLISYGR